MIRDRSLDLGKGLAILFVYLGQGIVNGLHVTNPFVILISVFVLQLITITVIIEITRRIKWLKNP